MGNRLGTPLVEFLPVFLRPAPNRWSCRERGGIRATPPGWGTLTRSMLWAIIIKFGFPGGSLWSPPISPWWGPLPFLLCGRCDWSRWRNLRWGWTAMGLVAGKNFSSRSAVFLKTAQVFSCLWSLPIRDRWRLLSSYPLVVAFPCHFVICFNVRDRHVNISHTFTGTAVRRVSNPTAPFFPRVL